MRLFIKRREEHHQHFNFGSGFGNVVNVIVIMIYTKVLLIQAVRNIH